MIDKLSIKKDYRSESHPWSVYTLKGNFLQAYATWKDAVFAVRSYFRHYHKPIWKFDVRGRNSGR